MPPLSFDDDESSLIRAAMKLVNRVAHGRCIAVIGCDHDGRVWVIPSPNVPASVLKEALCCDWSLMARQFEEWHQ